MWEAMLLRALLKEVGSAKLGRETWQLFDVLCSLNDVMALEVGYTEEKVLLRRFVTTFD